MARDWQDHTKLGLTILGIVFAKLTSLYDSVYEMFSKAKPNKKKKIKVLNKKISELEKEKVEKNTTPSEN